MKRGAAAPARSDSGQKTPVKCKHATARTQSDGAFDPGGEFDYVEIWTGVNRSFFNDRLTLTIYNYWAPEYVGETGSNDVLEYNYEWTFNKIGYSRRNLAAMSAINGATSVRAATTIPIGVSP